MTARAGEASQAEAGDRARGRPGVLLLGGALFLGELGSCAGYLAGRFGSSRVMGSFSEDASRLALELLPEAAALLLAALALTLGAVTLWVRARDAVGPAVVAVLGGSRAARWAWAGGSTFAFVSAWYGVHQHLLPGSRLGNSWLAAMTGAAAPMAPPEPVRLAVVMVSAAGVGAVVLGALWTSRGMRRVALRLGVASLVLPLYTAVTEPGPPVPFAAGEHVVLMGVDSLQMNRLEAGGGTPGVAPHMDAFLERGTRFDSAWTPMARTYPSWLSILTGRDPVHHGARFNLVGDEQLADDNVYLPERLRDAGYLTVHLTDEVRFCLIRPRFGFDEMLHPEMGARDFVLADAFDFVATNLFRQTALGHDLFVPIRNNRASAAYSPELFVRNVKRKLATLPRDRPVLLIMHLCGNHYPFSAPGRWVHAHDDPVEACIAMVDDQFGELLEWFDAAGLADGLVFLLSDHGDGWSGDPDDDTNTHGNDFDALHDLRVVLASNRGPAGAVDARVRSTDLYPTILEELELPFDAGALDGESLAPAFDGEPLAPRPLFAETGIDLKAYSIQRTIERNARYYAVDPDSGLVSLRQEGIDRFMAQKRYMLARDGLRLVVTPHQRRFELFGVDPHDGRELPGDPVASEAVRRTLVRDLAEHFGLDAAALLADAADRGFLGDRVAAADR